MPAERTGAVTRANTTRLKNRISEVDEQFAALQYDRRQSEKIMEPVVDLIVDEAFWRQQSDGLAILAAPDFFHYWRLPVRFEESSAVASHFNIKPLLPLLLSAAG